MPHSVSISSVTGGTDGTECGGSLAGVRGGTDEAWPSARSRSDSSLLTAVFWAHTLQMGASTRVVWVEKRGGGHERGGGRSESRPWAGRPSRAFFYFFPPPFWGAHKKS